MMLSEIITTPNSGDMVSGTCRSQALKDGVLGGPGQLTDHSDSLQKNFLSLLSQYGHGTVQVASEESSKSNLKLSESQLTDEAETDDPAAGAIKEKPGKGSQASKRLTSIYPKSPDFVLGLLSIPDSQHPDLSAKAGLYSLSSENDATLSPDLIAGGSPAKMAVNDRLPDAQNVQADNLLAATALSGAEGVPVVQANVLPKLSEQWVEAISAPVPSGTGLSQADQAGVDFAGTVQARVMPGLPEQWNEATPALVPSEAGLPQADQAGADFAQAVQAQVMPKLREQQNEATPVSVPSGGGLSDADQTGADPAQVVQGRHGQPDLESISSPAFSGSDEISAVQAQVAPKLRAQQHQEHHPDLNLLTEKKGSAVKGDQVQGVPADSTSENSVAYGKDFAEHKTASDIRHQEVKVKSASFLQIDDSAEPGEIAISSAGASNADDNGTPDAFRSTKHTDKITGKEAFQPPDTDLGDSAVNFARGSQVEKTSLTNSPSSSIETRPADPSFQTEILKQVVDKSASTLKSGQSELRIDLKPESLGHLRLHVLMDHQQVTVKILAENTQVKEMIERQASLIRNELQHQGIKVDAVNVDMLMSGGTDFASSHHEETAFKQARNEPFYGSGQEKPGKSELSEPDLQGQANSRGGYLVNYFA
ncbi:MAG: flagellar hook-length control protein FliK [Deltaproteobacteria bacterium]|nr:flagellar hook-length control protein FliK [Deltaproteobacteria bacterium]